MAGVLVSASTGAMGSLLGKLGAMLTDEYKLLKNVRGDIKFLKDELEVMNAFLLKMSDVEEPDEPTKLRVTAVREMSYKIEDNIDKFMLLVERESGCSEDHGIRKLIDKCNSLLPDIKTRRKIAKEVKYIKIQLKEVSDRFLRYKIDESSSMPAKDKVDPRLRAVYKDATELVGVDGPRDELVKWLNEKEGESLRFVSIVGYGGLGKTTLATQIQANLGAGATFVCGAFVSISRKPDMKAILKSILSQISKQDNAYSGLDDIQLIINNIRELLQDRRYFIIIDDIWESGTWETLKCAFVKNTCGSRIMITTRKVDVAKSCSPSNEDLVYEMKPLSEADSKKLFFKRIFGCEESCPGNLKEASEDILKKCRGLPLAINAISSLLATTTRETKEEWDRVRHSIRSSKAKNDIIETMNYILSLSYFDLPHHLRSCLLYLALFPEDKLIERYQLVCRWISEGFIHGESGQDLMELGKEYFHELVNRSLIQPEKIGYDGKAKACKVHDTILDFLIEKSSQENFCTVREKQCKPGGIVRRLSLMGTDDEEIMEQLDLSQARSIGAFGGIRRLPALAKSKSLRVLDLGGCHKLRNHHIKGIEGLYQLRYLDISNTGITELPREIGELLYLETLVATPASLRELPESITRLRRLTRLFVDLDCKLPDGWGNLVSLQELEKIDALQLKHAEELGKLTNLRTLGINLRSGGIEGDKLVQSKEKLVSSLCKLDKCGLRSLSIFYHLGENDGEEPFLPALGCIREVYVIGKDDFRFSRWLASLPNLYRLSFNGSKIEQQDIEMIGLIPNLLELTLWSLNSYDAGQLIISCKGFQKLQMFYVYYSHMGDLLFEPGAMPRLRELTLDIIRNEKPNSATVNFNLGIQHLSSLARLDVSIHCDGWTAAEVKAVEDAFKSMAEANPNRPTLKMTRYLQYRVLQDEQIDMGGSGTK